MRYKNKRSMCRSAHAALPGSTAASLRAIARSSSPAPPPGRPPPAARRRPCPGLGSGHAAIRHCRDRGRRACVRGGGLRPFLFKRPDEFVELPLSGLFPCVGESPEMSPQVRVAFMLSEAQAFIGPFQTPWAARTKRDNGDRRSPFCMQASSRRSVQDNAKRYARSDRS
jgi:hypothetical protein